ncbi:MAG: hypothetical protein IPN61_14385 [Bacteroidetes bacterium]|nr:hypothetical protein [Bacteroidota bacterium]
MSMLSSLDTSTDGDFTSNPQWQGDSADFIVNSGGMLQLNWVIAGKLTFSCPY